MQLPLTKPITVSFWRPDGSHVASFADDIPLTELRDWTGNPNPSKRVGAKAVVVIDSYGPWDQESAKDLEQHAAIDAREYGQVADEVHVMQRQEDGHVH